MDRTIDEMFVQRALREAAKGAGLTSPNPAVGAVLVVNRKVVATGHHRAAGAPHAEIECLKKGGPRLPKNSTLYITLEPCSSHGRTPPCTDALVQSGIKTVVIGAVDPNPLHAGRGIEILRAAGLEVRVGILAEKCAALNLAFNKWITSGRPLVIAKCGMSLDGRLTRRNGEARWITSAAARAHANRRRARVDAILIGAETLRADDPRLTVRQIRGARQPWRIVLSRSGKLPRAAKIFTDRFAKRTLVFKERTLTAVLDELGRREITSVLIEGGGEVLGQALDERVIDRVEIYLGSVFTGGPILAFPGTGAADTKGAMKLANAHYEKIGAEIFITGDATYGEVVPNNKEKLLVHH